MAMKMERLESFLLTARLKFQTARAGHLVVGFATNHYVSAEGSRGVGVAIRLDEEGRFLECIAPALYNLADCPHREAVLRLLTAIPELVDRWDPAIRHAIRTGGVRFEPDEFSYRDSDGDPHVRLLVELREKGEFVTASAPCAWNIKDCCHQGAVFESLMAFQGRRKAIRFDYDPEDGEIRPNIELPLEDAPLTITQFGRVIETLMKAIMEADILIRQALETGVVDLSLIDGGPTAAPADGLSEMERLQQLADQAGGIEELEKLLEDSETEAA